MTLFKESKYINKGENMSKKLLLIFLIFSIPVFASQRVVLVEQLTSTT
jgi:hypothetical protein